MTVWRVRVAYDNGTVTFLRRHKAGTIWEIKGWANRAALDAIQRDSWRTNRGHQSTLFEVVEYHLEELGAELPVKP